jgi:hypothetical protein
MAFIRFMYCLGGACSCRNLDDLGSVQESLVSSQLALASSQSYNSLVSLSAIFNGSAVLSYLFQLLFLFVDGEVQLLNAMVYFGVRGPPLV